MTDYYTPKRKGIGGWFAFLWGGWVGRIELLRREYMSTVPYRAVTLCWSYRARLFGSTGQVRGSKCGPMTVIFRRMTGGLIKLPLTGSYGYKHSKIETKLI